MPERLKEVECSVTANTSVKGSTNPAILPPVDIWFLTLLIGHLWRTGTFSFHIHGEATKCASLANKTADFLARVGINPIIQELFYI